MMPNLGQGGCQAIEDGFVLTDLLCTIDDKSQLKGVLQEYYRKRIVRSAIIQGMSRLSSDIIITSFSTPFKLSGKIDRDTTYSCRHLQLEKAESIMIPASYLFIAK